MYHYCRKSGFTLIELVIVMAILAIVALLASNIPDSISIRRQVRVATDSITNIVRLSRNQSIHLANQMVICPSYDDDHCNSDWNANLISFIDVNSNGRRDSNELIHFRHTAVSLVDISYSRNIRTLRFFPTGHINANGSFTICHASGDNRLGQVLVINRQGRLRRATDKNGDGVVEDAKGNNLVC